MRPLRLVMATAFATVVGLAGCGTVHNLNAPRLPVHPQDDMTTCVPFGGVMRTGALALYGELLGVNLLLKDKPAEGGKFFALGVLAWADIPLSLAGDIVTFPVAYARSKGEPWASWWGESDSTGEAKNCPFTKMFSPPDPTPAPDLTPANGAGPSDEGR